MIYWDIDGVIRDLGVAALGMTPTAWNQKINGKGLVDIVNDDLDILLRAPKTKYFDIINNLPELVLLSSQFNPDWASRTDIWLERNMTTKYTKIYTGTPEAKLVHLKEGDYLIDDCPKFSSFKQVAVVHYPYNAHVESEHRIATEEDLINFIERYY